MSKRNQTHLRVAVLWHDTVVTETVVDSGTPVTIGENRRCTLMVPDVAGVGDRYVLFSTDAGGFNLQLNNEMKGRIRLGGKDLSIEKARGTRGNSISVSGDDWGTIELNDELAVFFKFAGAPAAIPKRPIWGTIEASVLTAFLFALVAHFSLLVTAFIFWEDDPSLTELDLSDRFMQVIVEEPPPEIEEEEKEEGIDEDVGKKAGGEEGKFGEEDKKDKSKVPKRDGELVDKIKDVGIHKALGSNLLAAGPLKSVFGDKTGFDSKLNAAMSGSGDTLIVGRGSGGMGLRGTGGGGGGEGFGRIHGMGKIDGRGGRGTRAKLSGKKKKKRKVRVRRGKAGVTGFCKNKDIQRVVGRRSRGVSYCYEKELARNPELQGKITVTWMIGLDGSVKRVNISKSTLGSRTVEGCVKRQIKRWKFPKPEGGTCTIRYPFVFNSGL